MSPRAREILADADLVLAEDTRRAGLLFQRLGLAAPRFMSLHEHNETQRVAEVLAFLEEDPTRTAALISDAGTPLIADPGYRLVRALREAGHGVSPAPGPCAVTAALSACGLPPYPFVFLGFLPRASGERVRTLTPFATLPVTLVFYERASRLPSTLQDALTVLGERECCVARELTKLHEEFILLRLGSVSDGENALDWTAALSGLKGETTVTLGPPAPGGGVTAADRVDELIVEEQARADASGAPKAVAKRVQARAVGWTTKDVYERMGKR